MFRRILFSSLGRCTAYIKEKVYQIEASPLQTPDNITSIKIDTITNIKIDTITNIKIDTITNITNKIPEIACFLLDNSPASEI